MPEETQSLTLGKIYRFQDGRIRKLTAIHETHLEYEAPLALTPEAWMSLGLTRRWEVEPKFLAAKVFDSLADAMNDQQSPSGEMSPLTQVATTLQFCLEQLGLCKEATQDTEFHHVSFLITNAVEKLETAQRLLNHAGYSPGPAHPQPEGVVPA